MQIGKPTRTFYAATVTLFDNIWRGLSVLRSNSLPFGAVTLAQPIAMALATRVTARRGALGFGMKVLCYGVAFVGTVISAAVLLGLGF